MRPLRAPCFFIMPVQPLERLQKQPSAGKYRGAPQSLVVAKRNNYRLLQNALITPLSNIDAVLADITFVSAMPDRMEYQFFRADGGVLFSCIVVFARDDDGVWRAESF